MKNFDKILWMIIFALAGIFVYSCFDRSINVDDAWLGEPTMWFAKDGVIRSEALRGWQGAEQHLFFTHKLFILVGASFLKVLGFGPYQLKFVSIVYLVMLISSWIYFFQVIRATTRQRLLFLTLLILNSFIFEYGFIFRPEIAMAFYAFWTYFCLAFFFPEV